MLSTMDWVNFELGEDVRDEKRQQQDDEWAAAVADGRAHVSHRELTMLHAPQFHSSIVDYQIVELIVDSLFMETGNIRVLSEDVLIIIIEYAFPFLVAVAHSLLIRKQLAPHMEKRRALQCQADVEFPFRICLRKRPLLSFERREGTYDAVYTDSVNSVTLHDGKLARNGRQLTMTHHQYILDHVFSAEADNEEVCRESIEPLLNWAEQGYKATVICFGQTGTGKTYTLNAALEYIAGRLTGRCVRVTFFEIRGKKVHDLLNDRGTVHLRSDAQDVIHVRGAKQILLGVDDSTGQPLYQHADQFIQLMNGAMSLRSSEVTERNPTSSRSHAICFIEILNVESTITANDDNDNEGDVATAATSSGAYTVTNEYTAHGQITLVDLAGSERNYETTSMTAAQHKESADINFSLMALKDCFRAYHMNLSNNDSSIGNGSNGEGNAEEGDKISTESMFMKQLSLSSAAYASSTTVRDSSHTVTAATELPSAIKMRAAANSASDVLTKSKQDKIKRQFMTSPYSSTKYASTTEPYLPKDEPATVEGEEGTGGQLNEYRDYGVGVEGSSDGAALLVNPSTIMATGDSDTTGKALPAAKKAATTTAIRIPYRSSLLTRVLKDCFVTSSSNSNNEKSFILSKRGPSRVGHHRTTIIATVSPTPVDLQHSINTLDHVVLMSPWLHPLKHAVMVEVPLTIGAATFSIPVDEWTAEQVNAWLAVAERGRFAQLVLPKGLDGKGLASLSANNLEALFTSGLEKVARKGKEGFAWMETGAELPEDDDKREEKEKEKEEGEEGEEDIYGSEPQFAAKSFRDRDHLISETRNSDSGGCGTSSATTVAAGVDAADRMYAKTSLRAWIENNKSSSATSTHEGVSASITAAGATTTIQTAIAAATTDSTGASAGAATSPALQTSLSLSPQKSSATSKNGLSKRPKPHSAFGNKYAGIGQALWSAVRREQRSAQVQAKMTALNTNKFNK